MKKIVFTFFLTLFLASIVTEAYSNTQLLIVEKSSVEVENSEAENSDTKLFVSTEDLLGSTYTRSENIPYHNINYAFNLSNRNYRPPQS